MRGVRNDPCRWRADAFDHLDAEDPAPPAGPHSAKEDLAVPALEAVITLNGEVLALGRRVRDTKAK